MIESVLVQDYPSIEHIIIDDGSDDNHSTVNILKKYPSINWWSRENIGQYPTLNEGILKSKGDWILILSCDDKLHSPSAISSLVKASELDVNTTAIYGKTSLIDNDSNSIPDKGRPDESMPLWINSYHLLIHHCSMIVSRKFILENNLFFDTTLKYTGDWDWILKIISVGKLRYIDSVISNYRFHTEQTRQSVTIKKLKDEDWEVLKRHNASVVIHEIIILYYRLKKFIYIIRTEGVSESMKALSLYINKN